MAQLNHIEETVLDTLGNAVVSGTVTIRRQGAHVNEAQSGTAPFVVNVNDPGAIVDGDTVAIDAGATTYTAEIVTATTIRLTGFVGTLVLSNKQRITPVLVPPSIFKDPSGEDAETNPLTTDANGYVSAWTTASRYDALVEKSGLTTRLYVDRIAQGTERVTSNMFNSASAVAVVQDTARSITTAGAKLHSWRNLGVEKAYIDKDGDGSFSDLSASGVLAVTGASTLTGAVTMGSTLTMTTAASRLIPGATSFAIRNNANTLDNLLVSDAGLVTVRDGLTVTSGILTQSATTGFNLFNASVKVVNKDIECRYLSARTGTAITTSDFSLGSGWGTGPVIDFTSNATNMSGLVRITTGTGPSGNADFTMSFKDVPFSGSNVKMVWQRAAGPMSGAVGFPATVSATSTSCTVNFIGPLSASTAYEWMWIMMPGSIQ